jgi:hypothetical protein
MIAAIVAVAHLGATLAAAGAHAQETPPPELVPSPVADDPAGAEEEASGELVTLVLGLQGRAGVGADTVRVLNNLITFELGQAPGRRVLGMNDIKSLLEAEATKQLLDCNAQSCLAELAGAVDADRVVYGSVEQLGRGYFLIISEIDARSVTPVARAQRRLLDPSPDRLAAEVPGIVDELLRGGSATATTGVLIVTADDQVEIVVGGRGVGGAPAVVDDAPVGDVKVVIYHEQLPLTVTVPVHPARVTTVNVSLDALVGDVTPAESDEAFSDAIWTAGGGVVGLVCSGACCGASPLCGCFCGGLIASLLGVEQQLSFDGGNGTVSLGGLVGGGAADGAVPGGHGRLGGGHPGRALHARVRCGTRASHRGEAARR